MRILSIETSCDETSAAVIEKKPNQLPIKISSTVSSSVNLHALTGGIIPEQAARVQLESIIPIILNTLFDSVNENMNYLQFGYKRGMEIFNETIDCIAVTQGPGLIGSLLVGIETAKTLAMVGDKPIIPVNHLLAHIYANFIESDTTIHYKSNETKGVNDTLLQPPLFPFIGLIVSGGHTDLLHFKDHGKFTWIGGTRDDAAGEALDKIGRVLGLPYPAGPEIEKQAKQATVKNIRFSRALLNSHDFDFSFSGLKTEVARYIHSQKNLSKQNIAEICFAVQDAVTDILVKKSLDACEKYNCKTLLLGGGVSANKSLRMRFQKEIENEKMEIHFRSPDREFTTDNAAMIGAYAALNYTPVPIELIKATPELHLI